MSASSSGAAAATSPARAIFVTVVAVQLAAVQPALQRHISNAVSARRDVTDLALQDQWEKLVLEPLAAAGRRLDGAAFPRSRSLLLSSSTRSTNPTVTVSRRLFSNSLGPCAGW